jgi:hypothetical protein
MLTRANLGRSHGETVLAFGLAKKENRSARKHSELAREGFRS